MSNAQDTAYHNGDVHIFHSDSGGANVILRAGDNQSLVIEGIATGDIVGTNTQISYNKVGVMSGSENLTFDETNLNVLVPIKTGSIIGSSTTDGLGYNEIYRGTGPQSMISTQLTDASALGTDTCIAKNVNTIGFACPKTNKGCVSTWESVGGPFTEYTGLVLKPINVNPSPNVIYSFVNNDGEYITLTDGSGILSVYLWDGTADWLVGTTNTGFTKCVSYNNRILMYDGNANFKVYIYDQTTNTFGSIQTLMTNSQTLSYTRDLPITIYETKLAFSYLTNTYVYTLASGIWSLTTTINVGSVSLDLHGSVLALLTTNTLRIYENFVLVSTIAIINCVYTCTNGTYIFVITSSGTISIYSKISGTWTASVNTYTLIGGAKMSANTNYLVVGAPSVGANGAGYVFEIETYNNEPVLSGNNLVISGTSFDISGPVKVLNTTDSTSTSSGSAIFSGGVAITKSLFCRDITVGVYNSTNNAFKLSLFTSLTPQSIPANTLQRILFTNDVLIEVPLTKTTVSGGSVFTATSPLRIQINYAISPTNAGVISTCESHIALGLGGIYYALSRNNGSAFSALNGSCILSLGTGEGFSVFLLTNNTGSVSNASGFSSSSLQIYSLN